MNNNIQFLLSASEINARDGRRRLKRETASPRSTVAPNYLQARIELCALEPLESPSATVRGNLSQASRQ